MYDDGDDMCVMMTKAMRELFYSSATFATRDSASLYGLATWGIMLGCGYVDLRVFATLLLYKFVIVSAVSSWSNMQRLMILLYGENSRD